MRNDQADEVERLVGQEIDLQTRMTNEAAAKAHGLIQDHLGPDHKVIDMGRFYSALAQALTEAREQGQFDRSTDVLSLT